MIKLEIFTEWIIDLMNQTNNDIGLIENSNPITGWLISPQESHMIKKLKDLDKVRLCASYPSATSTGNDSSHQDKNAMILFIIEKIPEGSQTDEQERTHYQKMQAISLKIIEIMRLHSFNCDINISASEIKIEWEYNIYGGWNGLSLGFNLIDHD